MLSRGAVAKSASYLPQILLVLMVVHGVISIVLAFLGHRGTEKRKCNTYPKMNVSTVIQRASGILMFLLIGFHLAGAANHFQPKMLHAVLHPLFFATVLAHVAVSTSRALITLGIGNAKFVKSVDVIVKVLCGATLIAGVSGFYLCLFLGVAK